MLVEVVVINYRMREYLKHTYIKLAWNQIVSYNITLWLDYYVPEPILLLPLARRTESWSGLQPVKLPEMDPEQAWAQRKVLYPARTWAPGLAQARAVLLA